MVSTQILVLSLLSYDRLSKKPLLFKSFTGLTVQEFDNIFDKEITKRCGKHEYYVYPKEKRIEKEEQAPIGHSNWI
ncbi:MAG TPA: hypothetical protein VIY08_12255 [Candidatus Nitrosocosmicus sp.]